MCHMAPGTQSLGLLVFIVGGVFIFWHIWCFDRGKCLLYTRRDVFRWCILMMLVTSLACLTSWCAILAYVKYDEYYTSIPSPQGGSTIVPVPYQLWSESRQELVRNAYHMAALGWGLLVSVHAEETLYWAYLIGSIRNRDSRTWFQSVQFKMWIIGVIAAIGLETGVSNIETEDLNEMEHNIFFTGAILATVLFLGSTWLLVVFPGFIQESRRQGANPEVLGRLQYFKELNIARTVFRFVYASSLMILSIDAFTNHKAINGHSPFWLDTLFVLAYFGAVTSTALSIMILLPRSMANEAGASKTIPVYINQNPLNNTHKHHPHGSRLEDVESRSIRPPVQRPGPRDRMSNPWGLLGDRLNIANEHIEDLSSKSSFFDQDGDSTEMFNVPFAARPGDRRLGEGEEVQRGPAQLNNFVSPANPAPPPRPQDLNIVVVTSTVVEKE